MKTLLLYFFLTLTVLLCLWTPSIAGEDVNAKNKDGITALMSAAAAGNTDRVKALLAAGADVKAKNNEGETALYMAALAGNTDCLKVLLAAGADMNAQNKDSDTPLMAAVLLGQTDCVKVLLATGADIKAKNNEGKTVADYPCANAEIAAALKAAGVMPPTADTIAPKPATKPGTRDAPANSEANAKDLYGYTALIKAARDGTIDRVKTLIAGGADLNAADNFGGTALKWAAANGHDAVVKALLAAGANMNAKNKDGDTPLIAATISGQTGCVKTLLAAGADVKVKNKKGKTVADYASANPEIVAALTAVTTVPPNVDTTAPTTVSVELFPLYGISLGQTTVNEIAKLGRRTPMINSRTGQPYQCYVVNGLDFWYNERNIIDHMYLTYTDPLPNEWIKLGFNWKLSYTDWQSLLRRLGYSITIEKEPNLWNYNGKMVFNAKISAFKQLIIPIILEFGFDYEPGNANSTGTLYKILIKTKQ